MILGEVSFLNVFPIVLSILTFLGIGTLFSEIMKQKVKEKANKTEENKAKQKQERQNEIREVVSDVIDQSEVKSKLFELDDRITVMEQKLILNEEASLATIRSELLRCYYECVNKGYRNDYDTSNIQHLYDVYEDLNGNTFVADVMERFKKLPTKEEFQKNKKEIKEK